MNKEIKIEDLGWDEFFESNRKKFELDNFQVARVIAEHRGAYKIKNASGEYLAKITGKQMFKAKSREDFPAVGDWVAITEADKEQATIQKVLPRRTVMKRKYGDKNKIGEKNETQIIAANIDVAFVIESIDRDFNLNRIERYFAIASDGGIKSVVILNKTDLISREELEIKISEIKNRLVDANVIATSTLTNEGLAELKKYIAPGKTYCFLGSSGVGKSSLINKLIGEDIIKTENIGVRSGRGKHVTTGREMYFLTNGGIVIDNPGVREVGMTDTGAGVNDLFDEINALSKNCKFVDCTHTQEPGCAVLVELQAGKLDESKYANYISLKREAEHYEMSEIEKKEKNRSFGKFLKNAKKELKKSGLKYFD
ncbi:MAG TPA: ribosome small subunit-dependent GTPase A [Candidatus Moranbacteria bacterium]|nr:ribosome small subunit-dependent GTPase A [Candidatus Moranbacteria bacterium]HRZ33913.1 ribosome small subunit-dependent GTPase A [Candidatus Moranbacteria bacterium]